jgi:membrane protein DedA with SNARE-associated domain
MYAVLEFIKDHETWAPLIVFGLSFAESLAIISFFLPASIILLGLAGVMGAADFAFWPVWAGAVAGAVLGDWLSYWVGHYFKDDIGNVWPFSRYGAMLDKAKNFFQKWGAMGVFLGRFFGPLRAVVPLIAGVCAMRSLPFQIANVTSAIIWATGILSPQLFAQFWLY